MNQNLSRLLCLKSASSLLSAVLGWLALCMPTSAAAPPAGTCRDRSAHAHTGGRSSRCRAWALATIFVAGVVVTAKGVAQLPADSESQLASQAVSRGLVTRRRHVARHPLRTDHKRGPKASEGAQRRQPGGSSNRDHSERPGIAVPTSCPQHGWDGQPLPRYDPAWAPLLDEASYYDWIQLACTPPDAASSFYASRPRDTRRRRVVFVHIHKTGGSAASQALQLAHFSSAAQMEAGYTRLHCSADEYSQPWEDPTTGEFDRVRALCSESGGLAEARASGALIIELHGSCGVCAFPPLQGDSESGNVTVKIESSAQRTEARKSEAAWQRVTTAYASLTGGNVRDVQEALAGGGTATPARQRAQESWVTILRAPTERMLSHYFYYLHHREGPEEWQQRRDADRGILRCFELQRVVNLPGAACQPNAMSAALTHDSCAWKRRGFAATDSKFHAEDPSSACAATAASGGGAQLMVQALAALVQHDFVLLSEDLDAALPDVALVLRGPEAAAKVKPRRVRSGPTATPSGRTTFEREAGSNVTAGATCPVKWTRQSYCNASAYVKGVDPPQAGPCITVEECKSLLQSDPSWLVQARRYSLADEVLYAVAQWRYSSWRRRMTGVAEP